MGIEIATLAAYAGIASAAVSAVGALKNKPAAAPQAAKVEPPPQAAQAPDASMMRKKNATALTGSGAGNLSTFLTGPSGIDDGALNIGKNTLLGS